jgi:hypothetical protein
MAQKMVLVSDIVKSGVLVTNFENRAKPKMQKLLENKDTKLILKIKKNKREEQHCQVQIQLL